MVNPAGSVTLGIIEWVNVEAGYAGGLTLGLKARILGETNIWMPSVAIGAHNIIASREAGLFSATKDSGVTNEFYLAIGKSIEPLKMRVHLGLQTIPQSQTEQVNPYFGIEEYFGAGLYASLEVFRRKQEFHPSLFVTYRFLNKSLEVSLGAVRINRMFFDQNNQFKMSLGGKGTGDFVKPGIWFGIKYMGKFGLGKSGAFASADDRIAEQQVLINKMRDEVARANDNAAGMKNELSKLKYSVAMMNDTGRSDRAYIKSVLTEKLTALRALYNATPFEP
jgi:hypothetical protein